MQARSAIVTMLAVAVLQGCTVAYNELHGELPARSDRTEAGCDLAYSLELLSGHHTNTFGVKKTPADQASEIESEYVADTASALEALGCDSEFVEAEGDADLVIRVERLPKLSALPQEWLTGLSFGLIPSWGTRPSEYRYTFRDTDSGFENVYTVDRKSYSHLVLFPVFWVTFFTADESRVYKEAVTDFVSRRGVEGR